MLLEELHQRKQQLKQAASTPVETRDDRNRRPAVSEHLMESAFLPRFACGSARLQMPVLRVAVSEPDFSRRSTIPRDAFIDRMGACVMGFDATMRAAGDLVEKESSAWCRWWSLPDTGRRVFRPF